MAEAGPATREHVDDTLGAYSATFHAPFFLIDGPSVSVSKEELYRWLNWRVFYGRPRDEYPDAEKDQDTRPSPSRPSCGAMAFSLPIKRRKSTSIPLRTTSHAVKVHINSPKEKPPISLRKCGLSQPLSYGTLLDKPDT